ncbi:C-terminal binding protein [Prosthecomicrobium pneumaticum]|uniref:D-3-phosphoglycerate dehydrogenase/C-terminal binding protein n=1 Tax=Prosthecomicrobium pneumaticum TaxID=81895 RepID=A0A7W9CV92_9HYPH|nr:C-terminal binding protein [Prosthecomicrobium pneumaticum]MBB5752206.1 D-3-phosphoglycerate dehydrogenase/C-terminal binding protein [Prosthecomicrobium pneumaticum]
MRILKVNTYAPDTPLYQAFGPDVTFDIHRAGAEAVAPPSAERCRAADAVINCAATLPLGMPPSAFENCRIVVREGVGYDNLDLEGFGARGVPVCNVPDYGTTEVADHAIALMLAFARGTATYQEAVRDDPAGWNFAGAPLVRRLRGATFAVLGLGRIGLAAARRAAAFDMKVIFYDPYLPNGAELAVGYERVRSLDEAMARADVLSVHTPLNDETRGMVGAAALAKAKPGLIVVNTARGPIVDLDALTEALRSGRVAGAGLDVLPKEPADPDHALIRAWRAREAWTEGRLVVTPHAAFYSPSALEDMQRKAIEVIVTYLREGVLMNCVNREHLRARTPA